MDLGGEGISEVVDVQRALMAHDPAPLGPEPGDHEVPLSGRREADESEDATPGTFEIPSLEVVLEELEGIPGLPCLCCREVPGLPHGDAEELVKVGPRRARGGEEHDAQR